MLLITAAILLCAVRDAQCKTRDEVVLWQVYLIVCSLHNRRYFFRQGKTNVKRTRSTGMRNQPVFHATFSTTLHIPVVHFLHLTGSRLKKWGNLLIFKSIKGEGGAPELITLQDIFVFVLRQNLWYLCGVNMGYEFLKAFKISKIVLSYCFQAWNNWFSLCVPVITHYFIRYETRAKIYY